MPELRNLALFQMVEIVAFHGNRLPGGSGRSENEPDRPFVPLSDNILDVEPGIGVARPIRHESMDDIVIGQSLLAVVANHVAMIEARNGLGVERLPDLPLESLGERQGLSAIHEPYSFSDWSAAKVVSLDVSRRRYGQCTAGCRLPVTESAWQ